MRIFTVISPHVKDFDSIKTQTLDFFKEPHYKAYIVEEHGKKGTHPHLNVIWTTNLHKKYFSQMLKKHFKAPNSNQRLLKHKTVFNEENLKTEYLSKEDNAKILLDPDHNYDPQTVLHQLLDDIQTIRRSRLRARKVQDPSFSEPIRDSRAQAATALLGPHKKHTQLLSKTCSRDHHN